MNEPMRYRSDDLDLRDGDNDLVVSQGGNGDWYISIVRHGEKIGPTVRLTTSGARREYAGVAVAVANLYRALGGDTGCPNCRARADEPHESYCIDSGLDMTRPAPIRRESEET